MEEKVQFHGAFEDLPFIAYYLWVSLNRDKEMFKAYSPLYDDAYITELEARKKSVETLVPSRQVTGEIKLITQAVAADYTKVRNIVNRIESYVKKATAPLTISADSFGIQQVRSELNSKNDEGIVKELRALHQNAENNKAALEGAGYTEAISKELDNIIKSLTTNSTAQNLKTDDRKALTRDNIIEMNKLWKIMAEVMEDGKKIAREKENTAMAKDYTFSNLQKKVRQDRKEKEDGK